MQVVGGGVYDHCCRPCRACNTSYIGKTDRHQTVRWCEHLKLTPITRQQSKSKTKPTAIQEHITSTQHQGSLEDFEVIGRESSRNDFFLRVKESLLIKRHKPKLNENEASTPLCLFWKGLGRGGGSRLNLVELFFFDILMLFLIFLVIMSRDHGCWPSEISMEKKKIKEIIACFLLPNF